ncbi:MAG: hypothetical protein HWN68_07255 [Desulfobacterales bacterium]|nr:hypothetical protein [Desulfobacterales bacterium]
MERVPLAKAGQAEGLVGAARPNRTKDRILARVQGQIGTPTLPVVDVPAGAAEVSGAAVVRGDKRR